MQSPICRALGLVTWFISTALLHAATYTFTDLGGRTVTATITNATEESVTVKLKSGKESTIELSKLIGEDQNYVEKWRSTARTIPKDESGAVCTNQGRRIP